MRHFGTKNVLQAWRDARPRERLEYAPQLLNEITDWIDERAENATDRRAAERLADAGLMIAEGTEKLILAPVPRGDDTVAALERTPGTGSEGSAADSSALALDPPAGGDSAARGVDQGDSPRLVPRQREGGQAAET